MKRLSFSLPAAAAGLLTASLVFALIPEERALDLARKLDGLYRSRSSFARFELEIVTPGWRRTLVLEGWSKGPDRMLIRVLSPRKESGLGTLRIGADMWQYLPKADKVVKIPPSMMMGAWLGSDFTNNDLVNALTFVDHFDFRLLTLDEVPGRLIALECRPKPGVPLLWEKIVVAVDESSALPVWQKYFDEDGRVARVMNYGEVRTLGGRMIPTVLESIPQGREGTKSILRYRDVQFDLPLDDGLFSMRSLRTWK